MSSIDLSGVRGASAAPPSSSATLLGQRFDVGSPSMLLDVLDRACRGADGRSRAVMHANLHSLYTRAHDAAMRQALDDPAALVLFEGIALKLARAVARGAWWPDVNGTDLVPRFLDEQSAARRLRIALVGATAPVVGSAAEAVKRRHPGVDVVFVHHGFDDLSVGAPVQTATAAARPDLVLLALGTPLQEVTALAWQGARTAPLAWCVGGLFDYWAGARRRAPRPIRQLRLEWLWRLVLHPDVMWRRTLIEGPWLVAQLLGGRA